MKRISLVVCRCPEKELLNNKWPNMKEETALMVTELRNLVNLMYKMKCKY